MSEAQATAAPTRSWFDPFEPISGATISECGLYRYHLWRVWSDAKPILCVVMLNPSTADAAEDDPTIRRCIGFAKRDGYGGLSVRNLFAFRATDPKEMMRVADPVGPENAKHLLSVRHVSMLTRLVAAWGIIPGGKRGRSLAQNSVNIVRMNDPYCLGVNADGSPKHPLYLAANTSIVPWNRK